VNKEVRKAKRDEIDAHHKVDILKAAVRTLEHRKASIEGECQLFLANYFSKPRAGETGRQMEERKSDRAFGNKKR